MADKEQTDELRGRLLKIQAEANELQAEITEHLRQVERRHLHLVDDDERSA